MPECDVAFLNARRLGVRHQEHVIALSARRIGATVVTHNARDFRLIQRYRPFSLRAVART